jgi:hypothetical protein
MSVLISTFLYVNVDHFFNEIKFFYKHFVAHIMKLVVVSFVEGVTKFKDVLG